VIILYNPPSSSTRKPVVPLSLLALGAVLERAHAYRIVDGNLEPDPLSALDGLIRETGADILAVTLMPGPQLAHAVPHCREIKARHPRVRVVWGGYFPTQHYDVCLAAPYVDYVVRGHGEIVFRALVDALACGQEPPALAGLAYRDRNGAIVAGATAAVPDPNDLPDFPFERVPLARYARRTFMGARTLPHHSSYGCPFVCNFCAVVNMVQGRWLAQSAERTAAVAQRLVREHGADAVEFYDNNFFVDEKRTAEFAERIRPLGIGWWGEARIDTLLRYADRHWALLRESGLRMVFLGAESGSDDTLRRMNKGGTATAEKTLDIVAKMKEHDIVPELSFILGNPPDPEADVRDTIRFIRRVKTINPRTEIIMYTYTPVPLAGTLYDEAKASGFRFPDTLEAWIDPAWQDVLQRRSEHVPWLTGDIRRRIRDFERVLNAFYPTATDPSLGRWWRRALRGVSAWRYALEVYRHPLELRALQRLVAYQRPETTGF
jgi:anaerobic magnesium-protoporphyrin IX monomethyl ester cyclase